MKDAKSKGNLYWKIAVVMMALALGVQSVLIYRMMNDKKSDATNENEANTSSIALIPRIQPQVFTPQINQGGHTANLAPTGGGNANMSLPPLPQLNINVNGQGGNPVITAAPQTGMNQPQFNSFQQGGGGNINSIRTRMRMDMRSEMERMRKMMDSMFNMNRSPLSMRRSGGFNRPSGFSMRSPAISQKNGEYVFKVNIPGMDKAGIKANINGNMLTIFGTKSTQSNNQGNVGSSYTSSHSSFQNSFSLPGPVKADEMKMKYENNTLTIRIPKA